MAEGTSDTVCKKGIFGKQNGWKREQNGWMGKAK